MLLLFVSLFLSADFSSGSVLRFRKQSVARNRTRTDLADPLHGSLNTTMLFIVVARFGHQFFSLQVDSGSSGTSVPLFDCHSDHNASHCHSPSPGYVTHSCMQCDLAFAYAGRCSKIGSLGAACATHHLGYADGSQLDGYLVRDEFQLGSRKAPNFALLGATFRRRFASEVVDGIMGMSFPALDPLAGSDALTALGVSSFSFCGGDFGGFLVLSNNETELTQYAVGALRYEPLVRSSNFYAVLLGDLQLDGRSFASDVRSQRSIVDSGTTYLLMPLNYFEALQKLALSSRYAHLPGLNPDGKNLFNSGCIAAADFSVPLVEYPNISVAFSSGFHLEIPASAYLLREGSCMVLGIAACKGCGVVLGDVFMKSYVTVFDRSHNRVGFAPRNSKCRLDSGDFSPKFDFNSSQLLHAEQWTEVRLTTDPKWSTYLSEWKSDDAVVSRYAPVSEEGVAINYIKSHKDKKVVKVELRFGTAKVEVTLQVGPPLPSTQALSLGYILGIVIFVIVYSALFVISTWLQMRSASRKRFEAQ